ncbi:LytTR family transcriptional regulator DNA-binding domain-containing protein [Sneathiella marina]|uniref:LytTR family transcriptional regulator DNA-binding domain-containing protein n=1 Tax=Sneathiella marina TaxID=2950108 RepID=A0ABY4W6M3_9PROT|nr:MHYT domain-containing protein [Sneathiella marina]USG62820.1 LytTR family transcriptional regulator DNA-binding domain-containing protein [Sneathiella marina]
MPLEIAYSPLLVMASIAIAITASFTALRMTSNLRLMTVAQRKRRVAQGALALGGGIWSMHFVGMLAVDMPLSLAYAPLPTLGSALIAILVTGAALLSLHFGVRNKKRIAIAGVITGIGIVAMHYLGMSAISANCIVTYNPVGLVVAVTIGIAASIAAMELAYGQRTLKAAIAGAVVLGLAISAMHYSAMYFTIFSINTDVVATPVLSKDTLALIVALASFFICGLFLLSAVPSGVEPATSTANDENAPAIAENEALLNGRDEVTAKAASSVAFSRAMSQSTEDINDGRIPYDRNKTIRFLPSSAILMAQADGHYTKLHNGEEELFCPWPISRLEKKLSPSMFIRTHRSYLVNRQKITGLRRDGDKAFCLMGDETNIEAPVSRGRLAELREILKIG